MKGSRLALDVAVFGVLRNQMPPNCEILVQHYVGDWCFGLVREPHNRALYLACPWGFWELDVQQLVTTFAGQVQDWKRGDDVEKAVGLTGRIEPRTHMLEGPGPAPRARRRRSPNPRAHRRAPRGL